MIESTTPLVPKTVLEGCCQHVTGQTGSNESAADREDEAGPASELPVPRDPGCPASPRHPVEGDESLPWPTLSEGKPQPPGLEKQDTYLPGQGCGAGEDRTLQAVATGRADCSEPPPEGPGPGRTSQASAGGRDSRFSLRERGVRSQKPGCGRELLVRGRSRAAARCSNQGLSVIAWGFTQTTESAQAGSQKLELL